MDLKSFMTAQEITREELAAIAGVTPRTIVNWETGFKTPPLSFQVLVAGVEAGSVILDWWRWQAKRSKGEL